MFEKRAEKVTYFNADLQVKGVAPRCRKVDFHIVDVENEVPVNYTPEKLEMLKTAAKNLLAKYKNVSSAVLKLTFVESDTVGIETIELFGSKHQTFNLL